jgi:hypothetical protein
MRYRMHLFLQRTIVIQKDEAIPPFQGHLPEFVAAGGVGNQEQVKGISVDVVGVFVFNMV